MCLINFHLGEHPDYQLIVAANRDEFYGRPTEKAHFWPDSPSLLAGRDFLQKGTWLGITKEGRFAALTNIRDFSLEGENKQSRGEIVRGYLESNLSPIHFLEKIREDRTKYAGFNILVGDSQELYHYNNAENRIHKVSPGTHSLSNASLNTPWPKVVRGREMLDDYIRTAEQIETDKIFSMLENDSVAPDSNLPETGIGKELERKLSASFIRTPDYGTRSATVLLIDRKGHVIFRERTYQQGVLVTEENFTFPLSASSI